MPKPIIQLVNRTARIRDARFQSIIPGLQRQVSSDFAPMWGTDATLEFVGKSERPDARQQILWLLDTSDEEGDLGYHEADTGVPDGKVFCEDDMKYGAEISVTISHELLEMLADPLATSVVAIGGWNYALETCDAVEDDNDGYLSGGVRVSNFVLPLYFGRANPVEPKGKWDFCGKLAGPCPTMLAGGYLARQQAGGAWQQITARLEDGSLSHRAVRERGRSFRRASRGLARAA